VRAASTKAAKEARREATMTTIVKQLVDFAACKNGGCFPKGFIPAQEASHTKVLKSCYNFGDY
jgi:hypothetical protein